MSRRLRKSTPRRVQRNPAPIQNPPVVLETWTPSGVGFGKHRLVITDDGDLQVQFYAAREWHVCWNPEGHMKLFRKEK